MELAPVSADPLVVVSQQTGRAHIRYLVSGRLVEDHRCKVDDTWVEILGSSLDDMDVESLCDFCFPGGPGYN